jgi:hypothetical protein
LEFQGLLGEFPSCFVVVVVIIIIIILISVIPTKEAKAFEPTLILA